LKHIIILFLLTGFSLHAQTPLDSLMQHAESLGLQAKDYQYPQNDTSASKKAVQKFMLDLKFGKQPDLRYNGYDFKLQQQGYKSRYGELWNMSKIKELANRLINESNEVKQILQVLNDSTHFNTEKKQLLAKAANEFRWLNAVRANRSLVLVNIPSTQLKAYESQKQVLQMRVVLGKPSRPSKTLSSKLKNMIITPHWSVPRSISVEELVPEIRKNIRYFYASHLEIFDQQNRKIDPEKVPWHRLNANYFPYSMRQRTGKWNTLGILKIQFDNPFKMYLHDTSEKKLFTKEKRFYSHSCIRLEKPLSLGAWLLKPNSTAIDTLDAQAAYSDKTQQYINIKRNVPLVIWYSLVDFDENGQLKFYPNIYKR
jgi:murein L,D-transpeptidase YcbB/YkuD